MDLTYVAAVAALRRADDDRRFAGCSMFSALPDAPVVEPRRRAWRRAATLRGIVPERRRGRGWTAQAGCGGCVGGPVASA